MARSIQHGNAMVGDYVKKDERFVRIDRIKGDTAFTSDGGCMSVREIHDADIRLESEMTG